MWSKNRSAIVTFFKRFGHLSFQQQQSTVNDSQLIEHLLHCALTNWRLRRSRDTLMARHGRFTASKQNTPHAGLVGKKCKVLASLVLKAQILAIFRTFHIKIFRFYGNDIFYHQWTNSAFVHEITSKLHAICDGQKT